MQTENLFEFLYIILDRKKVTAADMAKHFGVSIRTIYRWVDSLCVSGVPLFMIKGKGGGISVSDSYSIDATVLNEDERVSLVSSIKALRNITGAQKNSAIDTVASKLGHLVKQNTDWIHIDFSPWNPSGAAVRTLFDTLKKAILASLCISFDYFSQQGETFNRIVQPWTIVFRGQSWYFYGFCNLKKVPRFFKLTRMRNTKVLQQKQTINNDYGFQNDEQALFEEKYPLLELELAVKEQFLYRILDELPYNSLENRPDGLYRITTTFPDSPWLTNWILSFGSSVIVCKPETLKKKIANEARQILSQGADE